MDIVRELPAELSLAILSYLDVCSLCRAGQTCHTWRDFIHHSETLWKNLCLNTCMPAFVQHDRQLGFSWEETLRRNFGDSKIKRQWMSGTFSQPKCFHDLPVQHMCNMDATTWGDILQMELNR